MYWTLELASKLEDAPWPATREELIDYAQRSGASDHGREIGVINIAAFHIDIHLAIHTPSGRKYPCLCQGPISFSHAGAEFIRGLATFPVFLPPVHRMLRTDAACFS